MYGICKQCDKSFKTPEDFNAHGCVVASKASSRSDRLKRLLDSGGCSQEYYDTQMAKLEA